MGKDEHFSDGLSAFVDKREMAHIFIDRQPIFYDKSGIYWMWNHSEYRWQIVDETDILNKMDTSMPVAVDTIQAKQKQEILEALRRVGRERMPESTNKSWIQFRGTIINIETMDEFDAKPKWHITNPIPWSIGDTEETPNMDRIFKEWVGEEFVETLYEIIAYCILPDYPIHRIFCFVGPGSNGKSKFMELITKFVGKYNTVNTELDTLLGSRFEAAKLYKKLVCTMGETNYSSMKKTSLLKRLTGQDLIGYEFKNKNPFDDYNYAKIIISTNGLPITEDKSQGFYRRWLLIDFPNTFSEKKDILSEIPDDEYVALGRKCVNVLKRLMVKREFINEGTLEDRMNKYEDVSNPLQKFIKETLIKEPNGKIYKWELKDLFVAWMINRGYREWSEKEISQEMKKMGFEDKRDSNEDRWWCWLGVSKGKSVKLVKDVNGIPTQPLREYIGSNTPDILDKLDGWKNSGDRKAELTIDFLKNTYNITEEELLKYKEKGHIFEVNPGRFKLV